MPAVLIQNSTVECGHKGKVAVVGSPKLLVASSGVLVEAGVKGKPVAPTCTIAPPPSGNIKCLVVTSVNASSLASKLKVSGQGVILDTLKGATNGVIVNEVPPELPGPDDPPGAPPTQKKLTAKSASQAKLNAI